VKLGMDGKLEALSLTDFCTLLKQLLLLLKNCSLIATLCCWQSLKLKFTTKTVVVIFIILSIAYFLFVCSVNMHITFIFMLIRRMKQLLKIFSSVYMPVKTSLSSDLIQTMCS